MAWKAPQIDKAHKPLSYMYIHVLNSFSYTYIPFRVPSSHVLLQERDLLCMLH